MAATFTKRNLRQRIERLVKKWRRIMDLDRWSIDVLFETTDPVQAWCTAIPCNEEATLDFNLDKIYDEVYDGFHALEEIVVHELVHCIEGANGRHSNEHRVTHIARAILRAYYREK